MPDVNECEHLLTQVVYDDELQSGRDPNEACRLASLRRSLTACAEIFGYANRLLQQLSGWLVSDDLRGEDAGCGGPG